ncbi:MAG: hypothetical protein ACKOC8_10980 [Pirellulales bacterium]
MHATTSTVMRWSPAVRAMASVVILIYLAAVILPPLAGPPPASELAGVVLQPLRPLVGSLYLGHGYRFFAPNPGPGHTIRWTMALADGGTKTGSVPDETLDRPRLLYHRRFMVSEKIAALVPPPDAPVEVRDQAKREWQPLVKGVATTLLRAHGGTRVTLESVEHYLPDPAEVLAGETGTDVVTPLGTYGFAGDGR